MSKMLLTLISLKMICKGNHDDETLTHEQCHMEFATTYLSLHQRSKFCLDHVFINRRSYLFTNWDKCCKITCGAAPGIAFLHHGFASQIIPKDIKVSNILLNDEFEAKVVDFGLACLISWKPS